MAFDFKQFLAMKEKSWEESAPRIKVSDLSDINEIVSITVIDADFGYSLKVEYKSSVGFISVSPLCEYPVEVGEKLDVSQLEIATLSKNEKTIYRVYIYPKVTPKEEKKGSLFSSFLQQGN